MFRTRLRGALLAAALALASPSFASEFRIGGHVGAVGSSTSDIGYGVNASINPYGWIALELDATFAPGGYFGTSPAILFYFAQYEEFRIGAGGGAGFHRFGGNGGTTHFAVNLNAQGEFNVAPNVAVGLATRHNVVFGADDIWGVFLTLGFRFEPGGGW